MKTNSRKKSKLVLLEEFINKITTDKKYTNNEIFREYFKYQSPLLLAKDLFKAQNEKLLNNINDHRLV